jgi:hypothetical protein
MNVGELPMSRSMHKALDVRIAHTSTESNSSLVTWRPGMSRRYRICKSAGQVPALPLSP